MPPPAESPLPREARLRVEQWCDQFEAELAAGKRPAIAAYLGQATEADRESLFRELLTLEREYLADFDETMSPAKWKEQFPQYAAAIDEVCGIAPPPLGQIRDYRLLKLLGQGGMGQVYQAEHVKLRRIVALKTLPADQLHIAEAVARFEREAVAVGQLDHPNIVRATDAGTVDKTHFLVMEFLDGLNLSEVVSRLGPLPVAEAVELICQTAAGLQHAHEHGLVHRDIKPSNVMLTRSGQVKLLDLGLARLGNQTPVGELTHAGQIMGTLDYMAPEQIDAGSVDIRADIYSLGATLYKLLTAAAPFDKGKPETASQKLKSLITDEKVPLLDRRPDLPADLIAVIDRMLARNPEQRFDSPREAADELAPFAGGDLRALIRRAGQELDSPAALQDTDLLPNPAHQPTKRQIGAPPKWRKATPQTLPASRRLLISLGAIALLLFGTWAAWSVITLNTPYGTVTVEIPDGVAAAEVQVELKRDGTVEVTDAKRNWQIRLQEGEYQVELKGGKDKLQLEQSKVTVSRGKKTALVVTLKRDPALPLVPPKGPIKWETVARLEKERWERIGQGSVDFTYDEPSEVRKVRLNTHRAEVMILAKEAGLLQDFEIAAEFRVTSGDPELGFGFVFARADGKNFSKFEVRTAGDFRLVEWRDGKPEQTIAWTKTKHVKRVYTRQKLGLHVKDGIVTATIDGHELGSFPLNHSAKGNVGLCVAEPGLTVEFYEVELKPLDDQTPAGLK